MSTRLEDSNTSQLIELTRHFRPRVAKRDLLVLVESDDDKPFWNIFFGKVKERYARITITTLKVRVEDSDEEKEEKGKDALMKVGGLGPSKVIAVDRDYDTLVPGYHVYSNRIDTDKYVLHTRFYSIENHKLQPGIACRYVEDVMHVPCTFNFKEALELFSQKIADALLLLLVYERRRVSGNIPDPQHPEITIRGLRGIITGVPVKLNTYRNDFESVRQELDRKYGSLYARYRVEMEAMRIELRDNHGKQEADYWKLLQGHTLFASIAPIMEGIACQIKRQNEDVIRSASQPEDIAKAISDYHQSMGWHEKTVCNEIAYCFEKTPHLAEDDDFNVIMAQIDAIDEPLGCVAQCPG